jgi:hypothetical protein
MNRVLRYFSQGRSHRTILNGISGYVLAQIKGEAMALHAARPENSWLADQACVVIGYVEAFQYYREGEFPWGHVAERLGRMRGVIARAEVLARKVNTGKILKVPKRYAPKPKPTVEDRCIRYEGRWVSRVWYARNVQQAA